MKREPGDDAAAADDPGERLECEVELHEPPSGETSPPDELTCPVCHKQFRNKYNLKRHSTVHAGVRAVRGAEDLGALQLLVDSVFLADREDTQHVAVLEQPPGQVGE